MPGTAKDRYRVTVVINGKALGVWDKQTGGDSTGATSVYRPGGMAEPRARGGAKSVEPVTVTKLYDHATYSTLIPLTGKGDVVVTKQPLDVDGIAFGAPVVYKGVLAKVMAPEVDSDSSDNAEMSIEVTSATITVAA